MRIRKFVMPAIAAAVVLAFTTTTGASAVNQPDESLPANSVGWTQLKPAEITTSKIHGGTMEYLMRTTDGSVWLRSLGPGVAQQLTDTPTGNVQETDLKADVQAKLNDKTGRVTGVETDGFYRDLPAGDGTEVVTFTAECADGKTAMGGGFSVDFPQHRANVRFVGSTPAKFTEIPGDAEGSVVASAWEVQVINDGPATSLRPWVTCVKVG